MSGDASKLSENVDLSTREDAGMVNLLLRRHKRWKNAHLHDATIAGIEKLLNSDDLRDVAAGARLNATLEDQNQKDEMEAAKYERLDAGKQVEMPTNITITIPDVKRKELDG